MRLYIVRHGKAEVRSESGRDVDRVLRPRGHRQAEWLGHTLASLPVPPSQVLASEAVRAWQTASAIARHLGLELAEESALLVDRPLSGAIEIVERVCAQGVDTVLVGHEPQVSGLGAAIIEGALTGSGVIQGVRTGECLVIELAGTQSADTDNSVFGAGELVETLRLEE